MQTVAIAMGAAALVAGVVIFVRSRRGPDGLTSPTALVVGLSLALVGYHLLAWTLPEHWLPLRVPAELWPLLLGGVVIAITGTLVADAMEARSG